LTINPFFENVFSLLLSANAGNFVV